MKPFILCTVGLAVAVLAGCSENTKSADALDSDGYVVRLAHAKNAPTVFSRAPTSLSGDVTTVDRVVWNAQKQQGKMYRYGGETPQTGFDCSGLTQFAFGQGAGVSLPRTAAAQYNAAMKISQDQATKGDLVFFHTHGSRVSHVGIYLGNGKFVHAPRTGRAITTEALDGYWARKLIGFGRVPGACRPSLS
ncbi:MAG: C40 family peptidase [Thiothrix sp.]|uniref:C40 family peptidase n=1 Tax=Thiothrix sp. TaxID=1032 RepID=UPI00260D0E41|nr:C40 family peptidase [Thiothrix sp.]MDD5391429.1 C40 family peptidase [Thiothrix sp.]